MTGGRATGGEVDMLESFSEAAARGHPWLSLLVCLKLAEWAEREGLIPPGGDGFPGKPEEVA